jgi:hypothetical protein
MEKESKSEKFYRSLYRECPETSKMFRIFPILFTGKKSSLGLYSFLILVSAGIEFYYNTYFLGFFIPLLIIAEHKRVILTRETVLDMCMEAEVFYEWESKQNSEFLEKSNMEFSLSDRDRCDYFYERINYVDCINPKIYIKRHYEFLLVISFLLFLGNFNF